MTNRPTSIFFAISAARSLRLLAGALLCAGLLSACSGSGSVFSGFAPSKWGAASPRVTNSNHVPKGGGRAMIGEPYQVAGRWYTPRLDPGYDKIGKASWYGSAFHGRLTANGEIFDQNALTAAHPTLPLPSYVRVTNVANQRSMIVRVNDRGPFVSSRMIDLSRRSAELLGFGNRGVAEVRVQYVGPAPLEGDDTRVLLASLNAPSPLDNGGAVRIAEASTAPASSRRAEPALTTIARLISNPLDLFGYADGAVPESPVNAAFAATEAVAAGAELVAWQVEIDEDARRLDAELGTFVDPVHADRVARAFALIAAVETLPVEIGGQAAVQVHMSWLKPGATRADAIALARKLGLEDVAIRD